MPTNVVGLIYLLPAEKRRERFLFKKGDLYVRRFYDKTGLGVS